VAVPELRGRKWRLRLSQAFVELLAQRGQVEGIAGIAVASGSLVWDIIETDASARSTIA